MSGAVEECDYFVIGAGIAGMTFYRFAPEGASVVVADHRPERYKIGESIVPQHFFDPQLLPLLEAARALPSASLKRGTLFVTEDGVSFFEAYYDARFTIHVDRGELEALYREAFEVPIRRERVLEVDVDARLVTTTERRYRVRELIVDCSGPAMVLARQLGLAEEVWPVWASWAYWDIERTDESRLAPWLAERGVPYHRFDELSQALLEEAPDPALEVSGTTILTRLEDGLWSWQIALADRRTLSLGLVSRHGPIAEEDYEGLARRALAPVFEASPRVRTQGGGPRDRFHRRHRFAWGASRFSGPSWALVGDAAFFGDPVYSVGTAIASNQAIRLARLLGRGAWAEGGAEVYDRQTRELFGRAKRAYAQWYEGEVTRDDAVASEVQEGFLNGLAFERAGSAYRAMWAVAAPDDASGDPRFEGDAGRELTELVPGSLRALAGSSLASARLVGERLELRYEGESGREVQIEPRARAARFYRAVGPLALSYRGSTPLSKEDERLLEAVATAALGEQLALLRLLGATA